MYERNKAAVVEEVRRARRPRPASGEATEFGKSWNKSTITANLSDSMLENNRMTRPKRAIDLVVSMAGHGFLLALAILLPLYFSNAIDLRQLTTTYLVAPPPPPPPAPAAIVHSIPTKHFFAGNKLYAPRVIPKHIAQVKDLPSTPQTIAGVAGGVLGGVPGGQLGGVIGGILGSLGRTMPLPPPPKPVMHHGPYTVGGQVQEPKIIQMVRPVYPSLAKAIHLQGAVVIDSVIDAKGNVTQMKLVSGPPLLVNAAFDAVQKWKYQPTLLNGTPVAVEMTVTVHFNLDS